MYKPPHTRLRHGYLFCNQELRSLRQQQCKRTCKHLHKSMFLYKSQPKQYTSEQKHPRKCKPLCRLLLGYMPLFNSNQHPSP